MEIPENVKEKMRKLIKNGFNAYIIGGAVRDYLIGRKPKDYDLFTDATGEQILKIFPKGIVMGNEERQQKILTVIVDDIEISQYRSNGDRTKTGVYLREHLSTCDFTMNAIACDIKGEIIDRYKGKECINNKYIKCVGNYKDRFREDPLRILRALRQSLQLDFTIASDIKVYIFDNTKLLDTISKERIQDEFIKMQGYTRCYMILYNLNILSHITPNVDKLKGLDGGQYHKEDVLEHSHNSYKLSCDLTDDYRIHIAIFFHDIGKGSTYKTDENGKISFIGHEKESVKIVHKFMKEYKFSNADIKYVTTMIKHHMMGGVDKLNDKTIIKIVNELEDAGISVEDMLIMTYCDNQGNQAQPRCKFNEFYQNNNWLRKVYKLKYERMPFRIKDMEINGNDVMAMGIKDGKTIGKVLKTVYDLIMDGYLENERYVLMRYIQPIKWK